MPSSDASGAGWTAERAAARKWDLEGVDEVTGYFDLRSPANGTTYQVKSARRERSNGNPGKFRFWREHLERLHGEQSAVVLALTSASDRVTRLEKRSTTAVLEAIGGRWYPSQHDDEMGEQYKLPWPDLLED